MKNKVLCFFKKVIILLFVYIFIIMGTMIITPKLTTNEYVVLSNLYKEMRVVDDTIKSDFYTEKIMKYIGREYILEELHRDSLLYTLTINKNALELMDYSKVSRVLRYIRESNLDFDRFVDLDVVIKLFEEYENFFSVYHYEVNDIVEYSEKIDTIVQNELEYIQEFTKMRNIKYIMIGCSYIFVLTFWCNLDKIKKKIILKGSKKV